MHSLSHLLAFADATPKCQNDIFPLHSPKSYFETSLWSLLGSPQFGIDFHQFCCYSLHPATTTPHTPTPTHTHTHKHTHTSAPIAYCLNFYRGSHCTHFKTFSRSSDKETRDLFCPWQPTRGCLLHFCCTNGEGRDSDSTLQLPVCDKGGQLSYMPFREALVWSLEG